MSDDDRLARIEDGLELARMNARGSWRVNVNDKGISPLTEMAWLVEQVNALEAQAALDGAVVNAAAGVEANAFEEPSDYAGDDFRFTVPGVRMLELRAALKAREGE